MITGSFALGGGPTAVLTYPNLLSYASLVIPYAAHFGFGCQLA